MKSFSYMLAATIVASAAVPVDAAAQAAVLPETPAKGVWIEVNHTDMKAFDTNLPTSVWYLAGRLPVRPRLALVADVPFSHARLEMDGLGAESSSVFGNPYLGAEYAASRRVLVELGLRAPLTSADDESFADVVAMLTDPHRPEAFAMDVLSVSSAAVVTLPLADLVSLRARGGVTGLFGTGDSSTSEAALDYGAQGSWEPGAGRLAIGMAGRWYATSDEGSFADNSIHHASLRADILVAGVRPGVSLRLPLDSDYREFVGASVGLYLQVPLR
jgi:hypothetical protein